MLRDYFRIVPEGDALQRREKVAGKIVILDRMLEDTPPYFYALLGVAESDRSITQMDVEIYNWFMEGFDTADLKDSKALLEELNGERAEPI